MTHTLLIDAVPGETRLALLENGTVADVWIDRDGNRSRVGDMCLGRIEAVETSLEAAFVTLPDGPPGYLPLKHMTALTPPAPHAPRRVERLVQEGETVLVQITRDRVDEKGPVLTTRISLPGRLLVYQPGRADNVVSGRLHDGTERKRLLHLGRGLSTDIPGGGFIIRTRAEGAAQEALRAEARALATTWAEIENRAAHGAPPARLAPAPDVLSNVVRDRIDAGIPVIVDDHALVPRVKAAVAAYGLPAPPIKVHNGATPLFEQEGVEDAIDAALAPRLTLPDGSWIAIDPTEALTAIDVNSGGHDQERDKNQTALNTDLAAVPLIARHLRLRDIGGMIVIDFITAEDKAHRAQVVQALKDALKADPAPTIVLGWTRMGLVEMTRRRRTRPLPDLLCGSARTGGTGTTGRKSAISTGYDIVRRIKAEARAAPGQPLIVTAHPAVVAWLEDPVRQAALKTLSAGPVVLHSSFDSGPDQPDDPFPVDHFDMTMDRSA